MLKKSFSDRVYDVVARIPKGNIKTYKQVANKLECKAYRAVGNALNKNPHFGVKSKGGRFKVPCHRVVNTSGKVGGFAKGTSKKIEMLEKEGVKIENGFVK